MAKTWQMYNETSRNQYRKNIPKAIKPKQSYRAYTADGQFVTTFRARGFRDKIFKLDNWDSLGVGREALKEALDDWKDAILRELYGQFPADYPNKGTEKPWINRSIPDLMANENEAWCADYGLGSTGLSVTIYNRQQSSEGFNYVQYVNDNDTNWQGTPFKSQTGYLDEVFMEYDAKAANKKYLAPALDAVMAKYGIF